jgi:hypothetical protein
MASERHWARLEPEAIEPIDKWFGASASFDVFGHCAANRTFGEGDNSRPRLLLKPAGELSDHR